MMIFSEAFTASYLLKDICSCDFSWEEVQFYKLSKRYTSMLKPSKTSKLIFNVLQGLGVIGENGLALTLPVAEPCLGFQKTNEPH
jgi:hypothetical protein